MKIDWPAIDRQILERLDLSAEAESLGLRLVTQRPTASGWLSAHAIDREDSSPNASFCIASSNGSLGRHRDHASDTSLGFFDLAAKLGRFRDWRAAPDHYAAKAGIQVLNHKKRPTAAPWRAICWAALLRFRSCRCVSSGCLTVQLCAAIFLAVLNVHVQGLDAWPREWLQAIADATGLSMACINRFICLAAILRCREFSRRIQPTSVRVGQFAFANSRPLALDRVQGTSRGAR